MSRESFGFAACVVGAALVGLGIYGYVPGWVTLVGGLAVAACGLLTFRGWSGGFLLLMGAWVTASTWIGWAARPWNLLVSGIAIVALGFQVGALATHGPVYAETGEEGSAG